MRFTADAHEGLANGAITVTFRGWRRPQAKEGGRYRVGDVTLLVDNMRQVRVEDITAADARRAGEDGRQGVLARLGPPSADTVVWRLEFHRVESEPQLGDEDDLSADDVSAITKRLARLDERSPHPGWTMKTLRLIADNPGVVSTALAESLGRERFSFKVDVRKLKRLGLTESLDVGYRLSPRGRAYLERATSA